MLWIEKLGQLGPQLGNLSVGENPQAGQITLLVIESHLLIRQLVAFPFVPRSRKLQQVADQFVALGKIVGHWRFPWRCLMQGAWRLTLIQRPARSPGCTGY